MVPVNIQDMNLTESTDYLEKCRQEQKTLQNSLQAKKEKWGKWGQEMEEMGTGTISIDTRVARELGE